MGKPAVAAAAHDHSAMPAEMAHDMGHSGTDMSAMVRDMRNRFWICLIFTIPIFCLRPNGTRLHAACSAIRVATQSVAVLLGERRNHLPELAVLCIRLASNSTWRARDGTAHRAQRRHRVSLQRRHDLFL